MALYSYKQNHADEYKTWLAFFKDNRNIAIAKVTKVDGGYISSFGSLRSFATTRDHAVAGLVHKRFPKVQVHRYSEALQSLGGLMGEW